MDRRALRALVAFSALALLLSATPTVISAATAPAGFSLTRAVSGLTQPAAMAFTPDGRMLIAERPGRLRVVRGGSLLGAAALDLRPRVCSNWERGLLGIAVDPQFPQNGFIYLYYTFNRHNLCPINAPTDRRNPVNRVSRFTLGAGNTVDPASELVLLDNIPSPAGFHNSGDLHFARDGYLYVSVGDGGCDVELDSGCTSRNDAALSLNLPVGKILRITRDGGIPPDNPYLGPESVRCNAGIAPRGKQCQEIYAWGLRNPFRIAFDPNDDGVRFLINDVGQERWEEINRGERGANYRWNRCEALQVTDRPEQCAPPQGAERDPIFAYNHNTGCGSITGGAFVPRGIWPAEYEGAYLYADYVCGRVFVLRQDGAVYRSTPLITGLGNNSATTMIFGPHGGTQALYYADFSGGAIWRLAYTGSANRAPSAVASASPTYGDAPLTVQLSSAGTSDADGDRLAFRWAFGDGETSTAANPSYTYQRNGVYFATLTVEDGRGGSDTATVRIDVGNRPPEPAILAPTADTRFSVGQTLTLTGAASDPEDGQLPPEQLTWEVRLHHVDEDNPGNAHWHPWLDATAGNGIALTAPAPEALTATRLSYIEVILTATDGDGLARSTSLNLYPRTVEVTFASDPPGRQVVVNEVPLTMPVTLALWDGWSVSVDAPRQQDAAGRWLQLESWSHGAPGAHTLQAPAADTTYTARFSEEGAPQPRDDIRVLLPWVTNRR